MEDEFNISSKIFIGAHSLVGAGSRFIDHDHGIQRSSLIGEQPSTNSEIIIGEDVWIGANCLILKGIVIGKGAVVGAGSVVTKSVLPYQIVAGVPATSIRQRQ